jgi:hypothetical protein
MDRRLCAVEKMENKMDHKLVNARGEKMDVHISPDVRSEIGLTGTELLTLDIEEHRTSVVCTQGVLWLTQLGDLNDHVLKAGQSFTISAPGAVLVQGVPAGKMRILPRPDSAVKANLN